MGKFTGLYNYKQNNLKLNYESLNTKFKDDKCFFEDEEYIIVCDGCILNLTQLKQQYNCGDLHSLILYLWKNFKKDMVYELKGSYLIVVFEKNTNTVFVSNDLLSKRSLYVYKNQEIFAFSNNFIDLATLLKEKNQELTINNVTVTMMLIHGSISDKITYFNEVEYIMAFECVEVVNGKVKIHKLENKTQFKSNNREEILKELDTRFGAIVKQQFEKNIENGYIQACTLSAGMDSRSTFLYGEKLGYKDIFCFTYSQSGSVDNLIAQQIALDYGCDFLFYPIDNGKFCLDVDELSKKNQGQQYYIGTTGYNGMLKNINTQNMGIVHTGLLGGEVMSDVCVVPAYTSSDYLMNFETADLPINTQSVKDDLKNIITRYNSNEDYRLFWQTRSCQNSIRISEDVVEGFSPFMHEDFYTYAMQIPPDMRFKREIYIEWMNKYIPNEYITTYFKGGINDNKLTVFMKKAKNRIQGEFNSGKSKFDMNPLEYWFKTNKALSTAIHEKFTLEMNELNIDQVVKASIQQVYDKNTAFSRLQALTVTKALNMIL